MDFLIFIVIILLGLFFGKRTEKKHYTSILEREEKFKHIVILSDKDTRNMSNIQEDNSLMIAEATVVSIDAFKKLMASFVNIFWGKMKAYESLVDRARREAVLKVKQVAYENDYNALANLRIETSSITKNAKKTVGAVEALAYASGIKIM